MFTQNTLDKKAVLSFSAAVLTLGLAATPVMAQTGGWYGGLGIGQTKAKDLNSFCGDLLSILPAGTSCNADDKDTGMKFFAGNQFNKNGAIEFGYVDLGKATASLNGPGVGGTVEWKATGFNVALVGTLPVNEGFGLLGRIGFFIWDMDFSVSGIGGSASQSASGEDLTYGLGVKYDFSKTTGLRLEWEKFKDVGDANDTGQSDIDLLSLSLVLKFQ